jgi:hypothetical protein
MLLTPGGRAEEIANLVVGQAEAEGAGVGLETPHQPIAPFYSPVILFQMVVQVLGSTVFEVVTEDLVEGRRVAGVLVSRDLVRRCSSDRHGGAEERFGGFLIAGLAQVDVDQIAVAVNCAVQVLPLAGHLDVRFINIPAAAGLALAPSAQGLGEQRRQLGFPVSDCFMAEHQAAQKQDLRQVPQAEFHPQPPQHDQKDHVSWQLKPVQHRAGPLIEAPPAAPAPKL